MPMKSNKFKTLLPYFLLAVAVITAYKVITEINFVGSGLRQIGSIITPFFYGFLLAYILNMPFNALQKLLGKIKLKFIKKIIKPFCLIISYLLLFLIVSLVMYLIIPYIYTVIALFISDLPVYYERVLLAIDYINNLDLFGIYISAELILSSLQEMFQYFSVDNFTSSINTLFGGVTSVIFTGFLAFISSIYILIEKEKFKNFIDNLLTAFLPDKICNNIIEYTSRLNRNFKRYIYVQTIDGIILGSIVTLQLFIMGSPYFLVLGLTLGILNYVPYFGSIAGSIFAIIIVTFTQGLGMGAIAAIILLITQQIDGNVIQPRLMGGSFSLSPLLIIISISIGGALAGVFGMIAAIPIIAVIKDILESIIDYRKGIKIDMKKNIEM